MHQFIYAVAALGLTMVLSLNMSNGSRRTAQRMYLNEAVTQLSGVAYDVLEDIERSDIAFDKRTDETRYSKPIMYPLVRSSSDLTPVNEFGGCTDFNACKDLDDFDGMLISRSSQDYEYAIELHVRYVSEDSPTEESASQTFAKRISATITHPSIVINGEPLTVTVARVVTYHRVTQKTGIWL